MFKYKQKVYCYIKNIPKLEEEICGGVKFKYFFRYYVLERRLPHLIWYNKNFFDCDQIMGQGMPYSLASMLKIGIIRNVWSKYLFVFFPFLADLGFSEELFDFYKNLKGDFTRCGKVIHKGSLSDFKSSFLRETLAGKTFRTPFLGNTFFVDYKQNGFLFLGSVLVLSN